MVKFKGCKLEIKLICQAPMVHFQPNDKGATLRASEVKPKLDRYLRQKVNFSKDCLISDTKALDYKLSFFDDNSNNNVNNYPNNNGKKETTIPFDYGKIKKQLIETNPKLTILCFHTEIQKAIEKYLEAFFICHNFGTMQGKGYGSFTIGTTPDETIKKFLIEEFDLDTICYLKIEQKSNDKLYKFKVIQNFYSLTKSGINFRKRYERSSLFKYMHDKKIDNEKAELKQRDLAPKIGKYEKHTESQCYKNKNPKYVRALLGVGISLSFKDTSICITHDERKIERYSSPLFFKIIADTIYIIPKQIDEKLYNQKFKFHIKKNRHNQGLKSQNKKDPIYLYTPKSSEFDLKDFLSYALDKYNKNKERLFGYDDSHKIHEERVGGRGL